MAAQEKMKKKVDEGWKEKISEEKEKAKKEAEKKKEEKPPPPEANFNLFISSLATQVVIHLGDVENPITKKKEKNLDQAKYTIDVLQILQEKTKGNLSEDETRFLEGMLHELKMRYVKASE